MLRRVADRAIPQSTHARRKHKAVATEHYLRDDVPCRSLLCPGSCVAAELVTTNFARLSSDLSHYCIPDAPTFALYSEALLEEPSVQGLIVTQTSYRYLQSCGSRKQWQQAQTAVSDPRSGAILFSNEFASALWRTCDDGEEPDDFRFDMVYGAAVWYSQHLGDVIPIVVITTNAAHVSSYGQRNSNVLVLEVHAYLQQFYSSIPSLLERVAALDAAAAVSIQDTSSAPVATSEHGYSEHLTTDAIMAGVKSGLYLRGKLNVERYAYGDVAWPELVGAGLHNCG
jgi:hypothetical protein